MPLQVSFPKPVSFQTSPPCSSSSVTFVAVLFTRGGVLSALRLTIKLEDHPLSTVRVCLFNISAPTHYLQAVCSIHTLRKRHAVVAGTHFILTLLHTSTPPVNIAAKLWAGGQISMPSGSTIFFVRFRVCHLWPLCPSLKSVSPLFPRR